jgi:glycosyltransferase involved in cell wall biosynthesis
MRVLGLALYGPKAASTRYRLGQYVGGLAEQGIDLEIRPLLGDDYLTYRFAGQRVPVATLVRSVVRRLGDLLEQRRFDAAVVHCELIPLMPGAVEASLLRLPFVYDFDDAFFLKYRSGRLAPLLAGKFDPVMKAAAQITAGNHVLASHARQHNPNTHYLPTVVDVRRYLVAPTPDSVFTVGWVGSPSTAPYLQQLVEPLTALGREAPLRLVVIGGKAPSIDGVQVMELEWSEADEVAQINSFHVGLMPLPDDDWARGKCAFKLIQYMACAVPVVASPVGANVDVVSNECGLLASTPQEWLEALRTLRDRPALRRSMGEAGRARIEQHYSLQRNLPVLASVLRQSTKRS